MKRVNFEYGSEIPDFGQESMASTDRMEELRLYSAYIEGRVRDEKSSPIQLHEKLQPNENDPQPVVEGKKSALAAAERLPAILAANTRVNTELQKGEHELQKQLQGLEVQKDSESADKDSELETKIAELKKEIQILTDYTAKEIDKIQVIIDALRNEKDWEKRWEPSYKIAKEFKENEQEEDDLRKSIKDAQEEYDKLTRQKDSDADLRKKIDEMMTAGEQIKKMFERLVSLIDRDMEILKDSEAAPVFDSPQFKV